MKNKLTLIDILVPVSIILLLVILALFPYFEMKTFNKYKKESQPEATYWDALFSELRVESGE